MSRLALAALLLFAVAPPAAGACPDGLPLRGLPEGDLGPAPAGRFTDITCLEVANDRPVERFEVAFSGIPLPRSLGLAAPDGLALIGPGGRRVAAQFRVLSRWGGPLAEAGLPIRWLEVAAPVRVAAGGTTTYALRLYSDLPAAADPLAARLRRVGSGYEIDTGVATFILDPANPALLAEIEIAPAAGGDRLSVYRHAPGAGPRLAFRADGGPRVELGADRPGSVTVDPQGFALVEQGPVKVTAITSGHFEDPQGRSLCTRDGLSYERFGFTAVATFTRGSRGVDFEIHLTNECSDAGGGSWTDDAVTVERFSWELPLALGETTLYAGGGAAVAAVPAAAVTVEQAKGGGSPWRRRARVVAAGGTLEAAEAFERPLVALAGRDVVAAVAIPWMRYREPQALAASGSTLSLRFVSEPLVVGEGKGLWNLARLTLVPRGGGAVEPRLEALRAAGALELERRLLFRAPLAHVHRSALFPSLGTDRPSAIKSAYRQLLETLHQETVAAGGQWHRAKTFGSQLWPDTQGDLWSVDHDAPADNSGAMNYWDPAGAELLELLRSGEPRWAWDFALPLAWLQLHTAYLNLGGRGHGNREGFAVTSGGTGEGHWHRSAFGSDDYTYSMGLHLAYVLHPTPTVVRRFAAAGATAIGRYDLPASRQGERERFVSQVDVTRQVIQHLWLLADCAEFAPGEAGRACHGKLLELATELIRDNLRSGLLCEGDVPSATACSTPQQFMQNALMVPFFHRLYKNYGDLAGGLRRALVEAPSNLYRFGIEKGADGASLAVGGDWAAALTCTLAAGGTEVASCRPAPDSDGNLAMFRPTKPHTAALLLMADEIDPSLGLCSVVKRAYDDPNLAAGWEEFLGNESGWWKGASQMVQGMAFGVGLYDTCERSLVSCTGPPVGLGPCRPVTP